VLAEVPTASDALAQRAATANGAAASAMRGLSVERRVALARALGAAIRAAGGQLATTLTAESGKPIVESRGEGEYAATFFDNAAAAAEMAAGEMPAARAADRRILVMREPVGATFAITPWNFPLAMIARKLAPALAAGCSQAVKPAEDTPLTALAFSRVFDRVARELGAPPAAFSVLVGDAPTIARAFIEHPATRKLTFTGSTEVGRLIVKAAAGNLKKVTLELGGKSPVVVFPDADLEQVIPGAARACFFLQGQNCMAGTRLFVHERAHDKVVEGIAAIARSMKLGPGLDPTSEFGPLISSQQRDRVSGFVEAGRKEGAEIVCGGTAPTRPGYFFEPTVLARTQNDMTPVKNEIFGPVLCVQTFGDGDLDAVARAANSTIYGLSGSVWTRDLGTAMQMVRKIDAGQVSVNMHAAIDPAVPFGGNKQSGWGREFGKEGLEPYLKTKGISMTW